MEFKYQIGDKTYIQKTLVLGQIEQLMNLLDGLTLPAQFTPAGVIAAIGERLYPALAVVLTEEGQPLSGKDLSALGEAIKWAIEPETAVEVIADFFDCNPIASIVRIIGKLNEIGLKAAETGLKTSSAPLPTETSPEGTPSSGDSPSKSADPI